jgi:hypothetical protein
MAAAARSKLPLEPLAWLSPRRLLTGQQGNQYYAPDTLVTLDPVAGRVVARRPLRGVISRSVRAGGRLVLLVGGARKIVPARIMVADGQGRLRAVTLRRIPAGTAVISTRMYTTRLAGPALAADPQRARVFVLGEALVAEVDLASLRVRYHELSGRTMLKLTTGFTRHARWLGDGLLAVSGSDYRATGQMQATTTLGVRLVDTRTWEVQQVDARATQFAVSGDVLLTAGGPGVRGYSLDGNLRYQVLGDAVVPWVQAAGGYAYLARGESVHVLDVHAGRVVATLQRQAPQLLDIGT